VVTDLINNPSNNIFVSNLTRLEYISALSRRYRNKEIDDHELNEAISGFDENYSYFHVEPLGQMVLQEAEELLMKYGKTYSLRTLDALHLATFLLVKEDHWFFVASDDHLISAAKAMSVLTLNPLTRTV
jgi:predicted nucleic acid-binding protein